MGVPRIKSCSLMKAIRLPVTVIPPSMTSRPSAVAPGPALGDGADACRRCSPASSFGVTGKVSSLPSRNTVTEALLPGAVLPTSGGRSEE